MMPFYSLECLRNKSVESGILQNIQVPVLELFSFVHKTIVTVFLCLLPYSQIISDALSFMVGGFHTSGYFITWLFWYLAEHPAVQEKLVEEVEAEVGGECGEKLKKYALNSNTLVRLLLFPTQGGWSVYLRVLTYMNTHAHTHTHTHTATCGK